MTKEIESDATKGSRSDRWYLSLVSTPSKAKQAVWLDPTAIYINSAAYQDLLDDLINDLQSAEFDIVVGIEEMGYPLGVGLATRRNVGFMPISKANTSSVDINNMELATDIFNSGTRVLLVQPWIEKGRTIEGAIRVINRQGGAVTGIAAIAIKENLRTLHYRDRYVCASAVVRGSVWQSLCNAS